MNKDFNLNTRTLIVSFVFALMVMIPLRFVEYKNNAVSEPLVLGETIEVVNDCLDSDYVDQVIFYLTDETDIASFEARRCK